MRKKLSLLISGLIAGGAIILLSGFLFLHAGAAGAPDSPPLLACATCHTMEKQVTAWQQGPHKDVACLQCHDSQDPALVRHEYTDLNQKMASSGKQQTLALPVKDKACTTCHAKEMADITLDVNPANGQTMLVKAAHDLHINGKPGLTCTDCHTVHSTANTAAERKDSMHALCQSCHDQKQVKLAVTGSVSCTACHVNGAGVAPADHKDAAAWAIQHGKAALSGEACGTCHLGPTAGAHTPMTSAASFTVKTADACATCHAGVTMPHSKDFTASHGTAYAQAPAGTCETCHGVSRAAGSTAPLCTSCHAGQTMPHPAGYLAVHGQDALKAPAACEACHSGKNPVNPTAAHASPNFCATCHGSYRHPAGWVAEHGAKVTEACAVCHSVPGKSTAPAQAQHNACAACHTSATAGGKWHPDYWFVTHANAVAQQGKAACMKCHDSVKPSCTQCHRNP